MKTNITMGNHFPKKRLVILKVTNSRFLREVVWPVNLRKNNLVHDPMSPSLLHNRNLLSIIQPKDSIWKYRRIRGLKSSKSIDIIWESRVKLPLHITIVMEMIISSALIWILVIIQHSKCQTTQHIIRISMESKLLWRRNSKSKIILDIVQAP